MKAEQQEADRRQAEMRVAAEERAAKAREEAAAAEKRRKEAAAKRAFERDRADIEKYLVALITPGISHRGANAPADPGPVSWSHLQGIGATADTQASIAKFAPVLAPSYNDRSPHQFANDPYFFTPSGFSLIDMSFHRRAHQLLRQHGEQMVREGLLAP